MDPYKSLMALREFTDRVGSYYGTETRSMFLYCLVKMHKPTRLLELGTGFGISALWMARALWENGGGTIHVADRGIKFDEEKSRLFHPHELKPTFREYFDALVTRHGLEGHMNLIETSFPPYPVPESEFDFVFSDFKHGPADLLDILGFYLPKMASTSNFFIDSAPSLFGSYMMLKELMTLFERGQVPELLLQRTADDEVVKLCDFVRTHSIQAVPVTENVVRSQNSFMWLRIQPVDLMPRPLHHYRLDSKYYMSSKRINREVEKVEERYSSADS